MDDQLNLPRPYRADLVFPTWTALAPWALPPSMAIAAPRGSSDDRHGQMSTV